MIEYNLGATILSRKPYRRYLAGDIQDAPILKVKK